MRKRLISSKARPLTFVNLFCRSSSCNTPIVQQFWIIIVIFFVAVLAFIVAIRVFPEAPAKPGKPGTKDAAAPQTAASTPKVG